MVIEIYVSKRNKTGIRHWKYKQRVSRWLGYIWDKESDAGDEIMNKIGKVKIRVNKVQCCGDGLSLVFLV